MKYSGIYAIVDASRTREPLKFVDAVARSGVAIVQYRAKAGVDRELVRAMHARTRAAGIPLVVNDDLDAALDADGWHAGPEDLAGRDVRAVRERLSGRIFGISAGVPAEAVAAEAAGADYVGTGPFAATGSKADAGAAIGANGVAAVVAAARLPVVAIGGIGLDDLADVAGAGAAMAAVIAALADAPDPAAAAAALVRRWQRLTGTA